MFLRRNRIQIKTPAQLELMRGAGLVVASALQAAADAVAVGVTTGDLDQIASAKIRAQGATPSFLGYHGFPATICVSVNDQVVHGIPGDRALQAGDLVSIDCGAIQNGWHADAALSLRVAPSGQHLPAVDLLHRPSSSSGSSPFLTAPSGDMSAIDQTDTLMAATRSALWSGLDAAQVGARLSDIGSAVEASLSSTSYGIVTDLVGHGIGTEMHMHPNVPNVGPGGRGPRLESGMVFAVEPMVTAASPEVFTEADDWTVTTRDSRWAAHWEHTVAITDAGPWVLTEPE